MRIPFLCMGLLLMAAAGARAADETPAPKPAYRVLLVGNSLTYANNLPALLRAVGAAQGTTITTETFAAPGGTLNERLEEGHVIRALRDRPFDAMVLQEKGGHLAACMASASEQRKAPCAASRKAYATFADEARSRGAKVLLEITWGPDERWDARLSRSIGMIAKDTASQTFNAAAALQALRASQPGVELLPDGSHPSTQASLMLALALYKDITGRMPDAREFRIKAPLLPVNAAVSPERPLEAQPALAGDGKVTVVPANLVAPLVDALSKASGEVVPSGRRR